MPTLAQTERERESNERPKRLDTKEIYYVRGEEQKNYKMADQILCVISYWPIYINMIFVAHVCLIVTDFC